MSPQVVAEVIEAAVHGRYLVRPAAAGASPLLVTFHGYAENAERNLEAVMEVPGVHNWTVVAVQALHPFYNAKTGEVVASWMTKLDREAAIVDNTRYVAEIVRRVRSTLGNPEVLVYAGFSQGTAMAYRAAAAGHSSRGVVALAGDLPPELAEKRLQGFPPVLIGRGEADEWYTHEKVERDLALLEAMGAPVEICVFEGGHEWTGEFRRRCGEFLRRCLGAALTSTTGC
ncbi:MAG: dienelactone hydrolase family protein [Thermoanaerobaculia bacterium]